MQDSLTLKTIKFIFQEILVDIFYFPIWWYSHGLKKIFYWFSDFIKQANQEFALGLWIKNLFVPMYGQNDWQGRLVSFFVRLGQIIARAFMVLAWFLVGLLIVMLWVWAPVMIVWQIVFNLM